METQHKKIETTSNAINSSGQKSFWASLEQALRYNPKDHPNDPIHQRNIKTKKK